MASMTSSSNSSSNAPVLPLSLSISTTSSHHSQPSDPFFSSSSLTSSLATSSYQSDSPSMAAGSIFNRPSSPTRVNLTSSSVPPFRISLNNRSLSPNSRATVSVRDHRVSKPVPNFHKKTCMCSPTTHSGSFRCSYHLNASNNRRNVSSTCLPMRLNLRRSAMTNSLVRIGTVEGDWIRRALTALIRPSSHQQRRRGSFQSRPSRLSLMSKPVMTSFEPPMMPLGN